MLWVLWPIDLLVALVALYFFLNGLSTATVMSSYLTVWAFCFAILAVVFVGGFALQVLGRSGWAAAVLSLLALPALCFCLFFLVLIISNPRMN